MTASSAGAIPAFMGDFMRFKSKNEKKGETSHGLTLDDVRGLIRKPVSYWAIDESGNPSRKPKENGKPFTLSAVTELSPIDYERLLEGVPLYDGEVHFSKLRNEHPDVCIRLMTNFGNENILILYKTVRKKKRNTVLAKKNGQPIDELYLLSLLNEMIGAVMMVDSSDTIVITYDQNRSMREETCTLLWNDRCLLVMGESHAYRLIQMADLSASSIGRSLLPEGFAEDVYFDKIKGRSINIMETREGPQHIPAHLQYDTKDSEYLTDSEPVKKGLHISKNPSTRLGGSAQLPPSASREGRGSDYKEPFKNGSSRSKSKSLKRGLSWN